MGVVGVAAAMKLFVKAVVHVTVLPPPFEEPLHWLMVIGKAVVPPVAVHFTRIRAATVVPRPIALGNGGTGRTGDRCAHGRGLGPAPRPRADALIHRHAHRVGPGGDRVDHRDAARDIAPGTVDDAIALIHGGDKLVRRGDDCGATGGREDTRSRQASRCGDRRGSGPGRRHRVGDRDRATHFEAGARWERRGIALRRSGGDCGGGRCGGAGYSGETDDEQRTESGECHDQHHEAVMHHPRPFRGLRPKAGASVTM